MTIKSGKLAGLAEFLEEQDIVSLIRLNLVLFIGIAAVGLIGYAVVRDAAWAHFALIGTLLIIGSLAIIFLLNRKMMALAAYSSLAIYGIILFYAAWTGAGVTGTSYALCFLLVVGAALFIGRRAGYITAVVCIILGLILLAAERAGLLVNIDRPLVGFVSWVTLSVCFFLAAHIVGLVIKQVDRSLEKAQEELGERIRAEAEVHILNDGLEQRVAESTAQLVERETFLSGILKSTGDAIITVNETQQILSFSQSAERIFGYTSNEVMGQPLDMLLPPQLIDVHRQHIHKFGGESEQSSLMRTRREVHGRRKDGTEFPTETAISKSILNGKLIFTAVMRDISERRQMEQQIAEHTAQLATREAFLSGIFNTAEDAIISVDEAQRILSFSQSAERIFGYTSSEIIGQPLDLLLPPQLIQAHRQHIHDFWDSSESSRMMGGHQDVHGRRKDGTEFPAEAAISKLILDGKPTFTVFMRDVTERKQMEKALREEEERFRKVFENSPVAIVVTTLEEGRIIRANDAYWKLSGHDPKTSTGKTTTELRAGYDAGERQEFINTLVENKSIKNSNYVFKDDAGRDHFTLAFFELIELDGQPVILSMFSDVTEQVEAQNALRDSEMRERGLLNAVPDAIFELRRDGMVLQFIPSDELSSRTTSEDLLGKSIHQIMPESIATQIMFAVERALESGQLHIIEYQLVQDGIGKTYETRVAVSGEDTTLMIVRDISLHKWLETEREKLINELDSKSSELERFTYAVSHDLKSPLITVKGFLGFLKQDMASGNSSRVLADIQRMSAATETMQHRLDDVLELSRVGRLTNDPTEIRFNDLVAEALELVHGRISQGGISVHVEENLPSIIGDHQRLLEVIQNLIDNAAKFMDDQKDPLIEIGQRGEDNHGNPIFFVKDNGMGIPPEYHEKIFGIFNKLDPQAEGTGVGLSLVKKIIETHGGRIWVESEAGQGAKFLFTLPRGGA